MTPLRLALAWSAAVLAACTIPGSALGPPPFELFAPDKLAHLFLFAGVGALWLRAFPDRPWRVLVGALAFGIGIELWQGLLPIGRSPEAADVLADAVGAVVGVALPRRAGAR